MHRCRTRRAAAGAPRASVRAVRLRIDELAEKTGVSSRNIRAYQARGLLPPPELEGRTGFYGEEHLHRLRLIDALQERGFSLAGIKETLDAWSRGGDLAHLLGFDQMILAPFSEPPPASISATELIERFPEARARPELVTRAVDLGLLVPDGPDTFALPVPQLLDAGEVLLAQGVALAELLDLVAAVADDLADVADRFVDLVAERVVIPALTAAEGERELDAAAETIRRLRPVALEVVRPLLARALDRSTESALRRFGDATNPGKAGSGG